MRRKIKNGGAYRQGYVIGAAVPHSPKRGNAFACPYSIIFSPLKRQAWWKGFKQGLAAPVMGDL